MGCGPALGGARPGPLGIDTVCGVRPVMRSLAKSFPHILKLLFKVGDLILEIADLLVLTDH